ncbi:hypothetical protein LTSEINV_1066 [Salmonella enterica subsp. enterica serovar Inverness str. R8-3668]|uniref:Uncharacterized protein n=1 Tax=Salmonella enterica subsp. enterica serovar Inverness str. R8-3668 TaxID=913075 RepID=G5N9J1_SALET|nr:hypothetical protein LTSEINV_1066 [Salmonella enterica subsp. enterica serovar Inverness str. R8-3668]
MSGVSAAPNSSEQFGAIADSGDGNSHVGDQQRDAVGIVRHKVAGFTEGIFGVTAHAAGFTAKHTAFRKRPGQRHRADGGDQPRDNGYRADFRQFGR